MYKFEVKVHIEGNNYYEKNRNTIQLLQKMLMVLDISPRIYLPFLLLFVSAG